jgi:hypothetical protein
MDYVQHAQLKNNNMLLPRLNNCINCTDIPNLIKSIDCKLAEYANSLYNNITYMLNQSVPAGAMIRLITYKRILTYKQCNPDYIPTVSIERITSRVNILTAGCTIAPVFTPEVRVTTTTTTTPCPTTTTTTTIAPITTTTTTSITPTTSTTSSTTSTTSSTTSSTSSTTSTSTSSTTTTTTVSPTTTTTTTATPTTTTTTTECNCVTTVTIDVTDAGTFDFTDCSAAPRSTGVGVGIQTLDYSGDGCITKNTQAGSALYTIVEWGPCC